MIGFPRTIDFLNLETKKQVNVIKKFSVYYLEEKVKTKRHQYESCRWKKILSIFTLNYANHMQTMEICMEIGRSGGCFISL